MSIDTINEYLRKGRGITISSTKTRPDNTTAYTAADVVGADEWEFNSLGEIDMLYLLSVILRVDVAALPAGMVGFKLHLYNAVTAVPLADNAPQTFLTADKAKYLTTIDLDAPVDKGDFLFSRTKDLVEPIQFTSGKVYGRLETVGGYTPTALSVYNLSLIGVCI
jgi:hypothetical protein